MKKSKPEILFFSPSPKISLMSASSDGIAPIIAIVLDRGSAIGRDKRAQFDLLFENESVTSSFGLCNATFEIVRLGY